MAGANEIEENKFVAGLRQTAAHGVISIVDWIDDGASREHAGRDQRLKSIYATTLTSPNSARFPFEAAD